MDTADLKSGLTKLPNPIFVLEMGFRQYCQMSDSPDDLSVCEKVPPAGGIEVRGMPLQARKRYLCAMLATSSP